VLSFHEDAIGIRLRDVIGVDNMMWGSDYPHSESGRADHHPRRNAGSEHPRNANWPMFSSIVNFHFGEITGRSPAAA
jgi:hypothetical protein